MPRLPLPRQVHLPDPVQDVSCDTNALMPAWCSGCTQYGHGVLLLKMGDKDLENALKLLKQRQKHAVKHAQGSRTWRERMKLGIQAVTVELDTRICQIHRSEPGESPTDCDVEEIARACATLRLKQFLARTRRDKKKEK
jgi:hypothetical protein